MPAYVGAYAERHYAARRYAERCYAASRATRPVVPMNNMMSMNHNGMHFQQTFPNPLLASALLNRLYNPYGYNPYGYGNYGLPLHAVLTTRERNVRHVRARAQATAIPLAMMYTWEATH